MTRKFRGAINLPRITGRNSLLERLGSIIVPEVQRVRALGDAGLQLRASRRAKSMRIDDAAKLYGVSADMLSRIENGQGGVRSDKLLQVLEAAGLELFIAPKGHAQVMAIVEEHALEADRRLADAMAEADSAAESSTEDD